MLKTKIYHNHLKPVANFSLKNRSFLLKPRNHFHHNQHHGTHSTSHNQNNSHNQPTTNNNHNQPTTNNNHNQPTTNNNHNQPTSINSINQPTTNNNQSSPTNNNFFTSKLMKNQVSTNLNTQNQNGSASQARKFNSSEIKADLLKAIRALFLKRNLAFLSPSSNGSTLFLSNVVEESRKEIPKAKSFYMNLIPIRSLQKFADTLVTKAFSALCGDGQSTMELIAKYLSDFEFNTQTRFDEDGVKQTSIQICLGQNPMETMEKLLQVLQTICKDKDCQLIIGMDHVDTIDLLHEQEQLISFIQKCLSRKSNVNVVIATKSPSQHKRLIDGTKIRICERMRPTPLSNEVVREAIKTHLEQKCPEVSSECLNRLSQMAKSNLTIGLELADRAVRLSNNHLCLSALEEAFSYKLNSNSEEYYDRTFAHPQDSRQLLIFLAYEGSFTDKDALKLFDLDSVDDIVQIKEALIDSGILYETSKCCGFVDPIYQEWIKNSFPQND